jgi:molybdopterin converting factor small subunit
LIKVMFFGPVAERAGMNALQVAHQKGMRLQDLHDELAALYPQAFAIVCMIASNGQHVHDMTTPLEDGSEVAFMAKFSGG